MLHSVGSISTVGRFWRSEYVKYAVRCHFRGLDPGVGVTHAEYACFTRPGGLCAVRSKCDRIDDVPFPREVPSTKRNTAWLHGEDFN